MAKCLVVHTTLKYFKYMVAKRQYMYSLNCTLVIDL